MAQFGMNGKPEITAEWKAKSIQDDPVVKSNKRGFVSFATSGANSRTTQMFINFADNSNLDSMGFSPFGEVFMSENDLKCTCYILEMYLKCTKVVNLCL